MTEHVLIVGGGREIPGLIRDVGGPDVATTILCRTDLVSKIRTPARHHRILALRSSAPDEEWIAVAAAVHARVPFTRVGTFGERDQDRAAVVAEALGLHCHTPRTIAYVHNKLAMRHRLAEVGVEVTPAAMVADAIALRAFISEYGTPCVVKPVQGAGSFGVSVVRQPDDIAAAFERACRDFDVIPDKGVLVERFHEGPQFSVEAFSEHGEHEILVVTGKYSEPVGFVEIGHVMPADIDARQAEEIHAHVREVLDALGISFGVTHTEIVLTTDGPRVIETHVRPAGDEIPYLVKNVTGVDIVDCVVRQTLGVPVLDEIRETLAAPSADRLAEAIWFAVPAARGTLIAVEGLEEVSASPGVITAEVLLQVGDQIGSLDSSESRAAFVRAQGRDAAEAVKRAQEAVAGLSFIVRA